MVRDKIFLIAAIYTCIVIVRLMSLITSFGYGGGPLMSECSSHGYWHVCDIGPPSTLSIPVGIDPLIDDPGPYYEFCRCRRCHVYRIQRS